MPAKNRASVTGRTLADFPHVAVQLDRVAHPDLDCSAVRAGDRATKLWWRCPNGPDHHWDADVKARCGAGTGCPFCAGHRVSVTNSLLALRPDVAAELHPDKEQKQAHEVTAQSNEVLWWRCPALHDYDMRVAHRTALGQNCPYCSGKRAAPENSLAVLYPAVAAEFHPELNQNKTAWDHTGQSNEEVYWQCPRSDLHFYKARVQHRTVNESGCPYCAGRKVCADNSLAFLRPDIAAELDPEATGFTADDVTAGACRDATWVCSTDPSHTWVDTVINRTKPTKPHGCPYCSGRRAWSGNNLQFHFPEVAAELDPDLNDGLLAASILPFADKTLTWRCARNPEHTWTMYLPTRTSQGAGCPACGRGRRFSRMEIRVGNLLAEAIPVDLTSRYLHLPDGRVEVDIPFPDPRVLVEYDGGFWHDPEKDQRKNARLAAAGWRVLRVRQAPLERLEPWDIEVDAGEPDPVHVALFILGRLRHSFGLDVPTHLTQDQVERALAAAELRIEELMTRAATARSRRSGTSRKGARRAA